MFGCDCYLVVECYGRVRVGGRALLDRTCMVFQRMLCLWSQCASKCSFHRFCMSEVISSFKSL